MVGKKVSSKRIVLLFSVLLVSLALFALIFSFLFVNLSFLNKSIAVIPIKGEISASGSLNSFSSQELSDKIDFVCSSPNYAGVLLDIDSPGGEVVASKQIVYSVQDCNKPVVSYIGSMGASGAYYIASASDFIVADEDSITGSIGVISMIPNIEKLLDNWGVEMQIIKAGEFKSMGSPFKKLNDKEKKLFEELLNEIYNNFKSDVLSFRRGKISESTLNSIADGRILSGKQALKLNLIDAVGRKKTAINKLKELAGIEGAEANLDFFEKKEFGLMDLFFSAGTSFANGFKNSLKESNNLKIYS